LLSPYVVNPPRFESDLLDTLLQTHGKRRMHTASKKCFYLIGLFIIAELPDDKIQGVSNLFLVSLMDIALAHIIICHGFILSKSGA